MEKLEDGLRIFKNCSMKMQEIKIKDKIFKGKIKYKMLQLIPYKNLFSLN